MDENLGEKIEVKALFKLSKILPLSFRWRGIMYKIESINYYWQRREGANLFYYFAVSSGKDVFELCFDSKNLIWYLGKVYLNA